MNIQWFDSSNALPLVTVAAYGLILNVAASELLNDAKRIKLGIALDCKKLYIKAADVEENGTFALPYLKEGAKKYTHIM